MLLDDFPALIGTNGSGVEGSRGEGLGLASVRFGFGVVLQLCFGFSVHDVFAKLHLHLIVIRSYLHHLVFRSQVDKKGKVKFKKLQKLFFIVVQGW